MSVGVGNFSFALGVASISWCLAPDKYTDPVNIAATVARVPQFQYSSDELINTLNSINSEIAP